MSEMESIRLENIRLKNENRQLTELTRKLLSQPAFSDVLETLAVEIPGTSQPDRDPRSENTRSDILESSKTPKYDTSNSHQIGLAMVPEQTEVGDFSQFYPHSLGGQRLDHPSSWMLQSQVY